MIKITKYPKNNAMKANLKVSSLDMSNKYQHFTKILIPQQQQCQSLIQMGWGPIFLQGNNLTDDNFPMHIKDIKQEI